MDTPGHADFGDEVDRVLSTVDSVLFLVDAVDGPMPQTRFVTQKAFALGLDTIVVVNKVDRHGARPEWVVDQTFELFDGSGATEEQMDFSVVYASALNGNADHHTDIRSGDMRPQFETIRDKVPAPEVDRNGPFRMQVSSSDYSSYLGLIGIGRVSRGSARKNSAITLIGRETSGVRKFYNNSVFTVLSGSRSGKRRPEISSHLPGSVVCGYRIPYAFRPRSSGFHRCRLMNRPSA